MESKQWQSYANHAITHNITEYSNKKDKKLFVKLLWVSYFEKEEDGREQSHHKIIPSGSNN